MAWALQFDGVDDYVSIDAESDAAFPESQWICEFKMAQVSIGASEFVRVCGGSSTSDTLNRIIFKGDGRDFRFYRLGTSYIWSNGSSFYNNDSVFRIVQSGTSLELFVDNVSHGNPLNNSAAGFFAGFLGVNFNTYTNFQLEYFDFICLDNPANTRTYSATASNHGTGTPVLVDTTGGNNATGVNMPTDGSAWIDLGGGSTVYDNSASETALSTDSVQSQSDLNSVVSELSTSNDSTSVATDTILLTQNESAQALDSVTSLFTTNVTTTELTTATDQSFATQIIRTTISEAITATDSYQSQQTTNNQLTESSSATDTTSVDSDNIDQIQETASATDSTTSRLDSSTTITEQTSTSDQYNVNINFKSSVNELSQALDNVFATNILNLTVQESANAQVSSSYDIGGIYVTVSENTNASDENSSQAVLNASTSETASTTDEHLAKLITDILIQEFSNAVDEYNETAPKIYHVTVDEIGVIIDEYSNGEVKGTISATVSVTPALVSSLNIKPRLNASIKVN